MQPRPDEPGEAPPAPEGDGNGALRRLASERLLGGSAERYSRDEAADLAGVDAAFARRLWHAMGFPDTGDERVLTREDVDALRAGRELIDLGMADDSLALQVTRVLGQSLARVAETHMAAVREGVEEALGDSASDDEKTEAVILLTAELMPRFEHVLTYGWRRHLDSAAERMIMGGNSEGQVLTVGFADLVGFTVLSQQLDERELAEVVDRFEQLAVDRIAAAGGRIVKTIGDEIMFVATDPAVAAQAALALAETYAATPAMPDVRVGLAMGPVVALEGDYFGTTVNLASRIVQLANPGTVIVSDELRELLADEPSLTWRLLRPRRLRGIGWARLWVLRRAV